MIIDAHAHPVLFGEICKDPDRVAFRKRAFGLYKSSPVAMEEVMMVMDHAKLDKAVILAEDYSATMGQPIVSNEEIRAVMDCAPADLSVLRAWTREWMAPRRRCGAHLKSWDFRA